MRVISTLVDKINSLQHEITKLTTEVNKLVSQAAESVIVSNVANVRQKEDDSLRVNAETQDPMRHETSDLDVLNQVQDSNGHTHDTANVLPTQLTSTPAPGPGHMPIPLQETPQPTRPQPGRPRPGTRPAQPMPPQSAKKILLIGDSIINGINKRGLTERVYVQGISGAKIQSLVNEIEVYDLSQFSHTVIYVGGNDANKTDSKQFEDLYSQLLTHIKQKSECKVVLVNSCPRGDVDTTAVNSIIRRLSSQYETDLVDAYKAFHDKSFKLISKYMSNDSIHLSNPGTRRLLDMINKQLVIVQDFAYCTFERPNNRRSNRRQHKPSPAQHIRRGNLIYPGQEGRPNPCTKCGETNHETKDCKHAEQIQCHQCGYYGHKSRRCGPQ